MTTTLLDRVKHLPTPCYLIDTVKLKNNLEIIKELKKSTNCQVILALKGFATFSTFDLISNYLDGVTASSIYEVKLGMEEFKKEIHVHAIGMNASECHQYNECASKITFNSLNQCNNFKKIIKRIKPSMGVRINPGISSAPVEKYDPCCKNSRLGIPIKNLDPSELEHIDGLHFHALCEQNISPLLKILELIEKKYNHHLHHLKWMNWGGGHRLTDDNYEREVLIKTINYWQNKYNLNVILEPGEAIGQNCGYYITTVLDIVENGMKTAICDLSITGHMPDVLEYPYQPEVLNSSKKNKSTYNYFIGGNTCLAGDIVGPYSFDRQLKVEDKVIFLDMGHYTIVKTSNFNGIKQPSIAIINESQKIKVIKTSNYFNFKDRLS